MTKKPFGDWLSEYRGDDEPIQDLKEDYLTVRRVHPWSETINTPDDLFNEMFLMTYCTEALEALKRASKIYGGEPLWCSESSHSQ